MLNSLLGVLTLCNNGDVYFLKGLNKLNAMWVGERGYITGLKKCRLFGDNTKCEFKFFH